MQNFKEIYNNYSPYKPFLIGENFYSTCESIILGILLVIILLSLLITYSLNIMNIILLILGIFICTGLLFIVIQAEYLGFMFLIIYAGAIIILFIFVLMLIQFKKSKKNLTIISIINHLSLSFIVVLSLTLLMEDFPLIFLLTTSYPSFLDILLLQKYIIVYKFYHDATNLIELSNMSQLGIILFNEFWFETLFLGFILLLALIYIIYIFKK